MRQWNVDYRTRYSASPIAASNSKEGLIFAINPECLRRGSAGKAKSLSHVQGGDKTSHGSVGIARAEIPSRSTALIPSINEPNPCPIRAELVEALLFTLQRMEKKELSFDKLRTNGSWR